MKSQGISKWLMEDFEKHYHVQDIGLNKKPASLEGVDPTNDDDLVRILENGIPEELEYVRVFHHWTSEQVHLFRDFAQLRRQIREKQRDDLEKRKRKNPKADDEELSMGAYKEAIEPQVRDAVLALRRKGYATYLSGFSGFNRQAILLEEKKKDIDTQDEATLRLERKGVKVRFSPNSISFTCIRYLNEGELKKIWDDLARLLPDLKKKAKPCMLNSAKFFRIKQEQYRPKV